VSLPVSEAHLKKTIPSTHKYGFMIWLPLPLPGDKTELRLKMLEMLKRIDT
jgi:hypothetical protein